MVKYVDISGLEKKDVLAALFNASAPYESGYFQCIVFENILQSALETSVPAESLAEMVKDYFPFSPESLETRVLDELIKESSRSDKTFLDVINRYKLYENPMKMFGGFADKFIQASWNEDGFDTIDTLFGRPIGIKFRNDEEIIESTMYDSFNDAGGYKAEDIISELRTAHIVDGDIVKKCHSFNMRLNTAGATLWFNGFVSKVSIDDFDEEAI